MSEPPIGRAQRVTPLELFFDLVVAFAFTQVDTLIARTQTWGGLVRAIIVLAVLWWAWSAYAWLTNALDPEEGAVRLAFLAAIGAMLVASMAAPGAFGDEAVIFGVAYLVVRLLHLVLFAKAGRKDPDLFRAVVRTLPAGIVGPILLIVAGLTHGSAQLALWGVAVAVLYLSPLIGHMRGFTVSPEHFVERFGLIVIIALGESIVAIGVGAAGLALDAAVIIGALLGVAVAACLWWSYFDWTIYAAQARLAEATGETRAALARDAWSYLHLPMVAGIILFAFGLRTALPHLGTALTAIGAVCLCGGVGLYFLSHVVVRLRVGGGLGHGRPIAAVVLFALIPVAMHVPAMAAIATVAAVCVALIAYEVLRWRDARRWIRERREGFTTEEARQVQANHPIGRERRRPD